MKTINLAKALYKNKNCLGFVWRFKNGRYGYQNTNDLGLCLDEVDFKQKYVKKIYIGRYYVYQVRGGYDDDGTGAGLKTIIACLKACYSWTFKLTEHEQKLADKYF